jgi:hypothetical protein
MGYIRFQDGMGVLEGLCSCLKHKGNRRRVSGMYEVMYGVHVEVCPLVACLLILHSATIRAFLFFFLFNHKQATLLYSHRIGFPLLC